MINHVWTVICEQTLVNPETNNISLINTLNEIPVIKINQEKDKYTLDKFLICSKWHKTGDRKETFSFKAIIADGEKVLETATPDEMAIDSDGTMVSLNLEVNALNVKNHGLHQIQIEYKTGAQKKWRNVATIPFHVNKLTNAEINSPTKAKTK